MPELADDWYQRRTDEELRDLRRVLSEVTPRREIDLRFQSIKDQLDGMDSRMESIEKKVDGIVERVGRNSLPTWLVSGVISAIILFVSYFLPHAGR